ncbi:MAG TPA: ankyrin repeat domain-containing protein, partial [Gammaproteobacteria bacterium]|nr:ankyrin repeat domain-containing protein [Gammaproteobacteria bacterium]
MTRKRTKQLQQIIQDWQHKLWSDASTPDKAMHFYNNALPTVALLGDAWLPAEKHRLHSELFRIMCSNVDSMQFSDVFEKQKFFEFLREVMERGQINISDIARDLFHGHSDFIKELFTSDYFKMQIANYENKGLLFAALGQSRWYGWYNNDIQTFYADIMKIISQIFSADLLTFRNPQGKTILHIACTSTQDADFISNLFAAFPSLANVLDNDGNSALYYAMNELSSGDSYSHECNAISHELYEQLMASNAKYIRDFKEEKSLLHLKVAMGMPLKLKNCTIADLDVQDLEQGKTPLHYAVVLQNHEAALELIEHGASLLLADKLGNNAIYYAILNGSEQLVAAMFQNLSVERQQKLFNALNVNSYIKAACFSGKRNIYDFIVKIIAPELLANNAITNQIALGIFMPQLMKNLAATEQLEAVAAVTKMLPNIESTADKYVKSHILPLIGEGAKSLLPGRAYGVELELSNLPCIPGVPLNKLLSWFSANITQDGSVNMPIFSISNTCSQGEEIV